MSLWEVAHYKISLSSSHFKSQIKCLPLSKNLFALLFQSWALFPLLIFSFFVCVITTPDKLQPYFEATFVSSLNSFVCRSHKDLHYFKTCLKSQMIYDKLPVSPFNFPCIFLQFKGRIWQSSIGHLEPYSMHLSIIMVHVSTLKSNAVI